jgi:hypothetical protein
MTSSRLFFSPLQQDFSEWIRRGGCLFSRAVLWKNQCFFFRSFVLVLAPLRSMLLWARMAALMINMIFCVFFPRHCNRIWASECVVVDACVVASWFWWIIYLLYCIVLFVCRMIMSEGNFEIAASRVQQGSATCWYIYFALKEHGVEWPLLWS